MLSKQPIFSVSMTAREGIKLEHSDNVEGGVELKDTLHPGCQRRSWNISGFKLESDISILKSKTWETGEVFIILTNNKTLVIKNKRKLIKKHSEKEVSQRKWKKPYITWDEQK